MHGSPLSFGTIAGMPSCVNRALAAGRFIRTVLVFVPGMVW